MDFQVEKQWNTYAKLVDMQEDLKNKFSEHIMLRKGVISKSL